MKLVCNCVSFFGCGVWLLWVVCLVCCSSIVRIWVWNMVFMFLRLWFFCWLCLVLLFWVVCFSWVKMVGVLLVKVCVSEVMVLVFLFIVFSSWFGLMW